MGKLFTIVGNTGCGKTTLAKLLCQDAAYTGFLEQHHERPFQDTFMQDRKTAAFANQVDFMLFRAEQEAAIRTSAVTGIQDGGLDQDFYVFTRLFHHNHYLSEGEFELCARFYALARRTLPLPDGMIRLVTPVPLLAERRRLRNRDLDIAQSADLPLIETLLAEWFNGAYPRPPCLEVDTSDNDPTFCMALPRIREFIAQIPA
jgi:deoxyadenosine/deoxycytidine kinase